jgi:hypothetical protein
MNPSKELKRRIIKMRKTMGWIKIVAILQAEFPDETNLYENVRHWSYAEVTGPIGVIGDTHFPFVHQNYLQFLQDTFEKYNVSRVIHIGDLCDNHAISRWPSEPDAWGACQEYDAAMDCVQKYVEAFPEVTLVLGNHDVKPLRWACRRSMSNRSKTFGIYRKSGRLSSN